MADWNAQFEADIDIGGKQVILQVVYTITDDEVTIVNCWDMENPDVEHLDEGMTPDELDELKGQCKADRREFDIEDESDE